MDKFASTTDNNEKLSFKQKIQELRESEAFNNSAESDIIKAYLITIDFDLIDKELVVMMQGLRPTARTGSNAPSVKINKIRQGIATQRDLNEYKKFINAYCDEDIFSKI